MTLAKPRAKAGSLPGRIITTSSDLEATEEYSTVTDTILAPLTLASVSQWPSGILVEIQFIPQGIINLEFSASTRSKSIVCCPVTIGWPGGRSVCQE